MANFDVIVVGGGPTGVKCALELAHGGKKVALVEKDAIGGTCLNKGCIPSKAYLYLTELLGYFKKVKRFGIEAVQPQVVWETAKKKKDQNVKMLGMALTKALANAGVEVFTGMGTVKSAKEVEVVGEETTVLQADQIVLALGTVPVFPGIMAKGEHVVSSTEVLNFEQIPESMCIIGGGVTGTEMASVFCELGTKVTLIELMPNLLPALDSDVTDQLAKSLKKKGCEIYLESEVLSAQDQEGSAVVRFKTGGEEKEITVDKTLVVVGRRTSYDLAALEAVGIKHDGRRVELDDDYQTSVPGIYMIGDAAMKNLTAYGGEAEAEFVAKRILGKEARSPDIYNLSTVFSHPEIGHVGMSEKDCQAAGIEYEVLRSDYAANAKAVIMVERDGFAKIIVEAGTGKVLGAQIVGTHAADLIHQAIIPVAQGMTVDQWLEMPWSHPVLSEIFKSALESQRH